MDAMRAEGTAIAARPVDPRLRRIASITGVPVEAFFGGSDMRLAAELGELITLWQAVSDAAGRARILACARTLAGRAGEGAAGPE